MIKTLDQLQDDKTVRGETRAKIRGLLRQAMKAKTYYGLLLWSNIWVAWVCGQEFAYTKASALGALNCAELLMKRTEALRDDAVTDTMLQTVSIAGLEMPGERRVAKTTVRFWHGAESEEDAQVGECSAYWFSSPSYWRFSWKWWETFAPILPRQLKTLPQTYLIPIHKQGPQRSWKPY